MNELATKARIRNLGERRIERVSIPLRPHEKALLEDLAWETGLPMAEIARQGLMRRLRQYERERQKRQRERDGVETAQGAD